MITCTRKLWFCAGHRVKGHEGKCNHLHGHNYTVFITAAAKELDAIGRVIDFSILKDRFGTYIDTNFDHGFLVWEKDTETLSALATMGRQKMFIMDTNPTAENIAQHLLDHSDEILQSNDVMVTRVVVYETDNCYAEAV